MTLKQQSADWVRSVVPKHAAKNARRYIWTTYVAEVSHDAFGGITYLSPQEGKVVEQSDLFTLVKTGPSSFCVTLTSLLAQPVSIGDRVRLEFYQLRRFDGSLADGMEDASVDGSRTMTLTGTETRFPVTWPKRYLGIDEKFESRYQPIRNPYLQDLIQQMEKMPANSGLRRVVNILVDANPTNLQFVDPTEENSATTPPAIRLHVATKKLVGLVEVSYCRGSDTYSIGITPADQEQEPRTIDDVHFDELGDALQVLIDDESWMQVKVTVLKKAPRAKVIGEAA